MVGASDSSNIRARDDSQYLFKIRLEIDLARKVGVEVQAGKIQLRPEIFLHLISYALSPLEARRSNGKESF